MSNGKVKMTTSEVEAIRRNYSLAVDLYKNATKTKKEKLEAADKMEFWGNKLSFIASGACEVVDEATLPVKLYRNNTFVRRNGEYTEIVFVETKNELPANFDRNIFVEVDANEYAAELARCTRLGSIREMGKEYIQYGFL